nr:hypothetical protein [Tanacetum cinerariifolium]
MRTSKYSIHTIKRSSRNRRIRRRHYNLIPVESKFKNLVLDHQDKYMMKAQVHVSKSSAISDEQALPRRKYFYYQVVKHMSRDEEVDAINVLRVDNSIQNSEHEYSESEDSNFDNPPVPLPPPKPPDKGFDFEIKISVVRSVIVKFECIDARVKFDVFNDENNVLSYFMFKEFSFLSAESEDTIFDPGISE